MGRTLPTVVQLIRAEEEAWKHFRRALRKEDQEAFDELMRLMRRHTAPICMAGRAVPYDAVVMAMLVGAMRAVMDLQQSRETRRGPEEKPDGVDI
jgi:hypothetical protein